MSNEQFNIGWEYIHTYFHRKINTNQVELIYERFQNRDGKKFIVACKELCGRVDGFPQNLGKAIMEVMMLITIDSPEEKQILGCGECHSGLIYYTRDGYSYIAKCSCKAGQENRFAIPFFGDLIFPKDLVIVKEEGRKKVSDRECREAKNKLWKLLEQDSFVKTLPPSDTFDNSEFTEGEIEKSKEEARALFDGLGGERDHFKEKDRKKNIQDKESDLPF